MDAGGSLKSYTCGAIYSWKIPVDEHSQIPVYNTPQPYGTIQRLGIVQRRGNKINTNITISFV